MELCEVSLARWLDSAIKFLLDGDRSARPRHPELVLPLSGTLWRSEDAIFWQVAAIDLPCDHRAMHRHPLLSSDFDRLVYQSEHLTVGSFRASVAHPRFSDSGPAPGHFFVFPRTAVAIQHEGQRQFVAGPPIVTYYNQGQIYRRAAIAADGDRCEWFALSETLLSSVIAATDAAHDGNRGRPFRVPFGPSDATCYLAQRRFVEDCLGGRAPDALTAEEWAAHLLHAVLGYCTPVPRTQARSTTLARERDLVEQAKIELLQPDRWHWGLQVLAQRLGCSAFHLCRVFRRHSGSSLHAFKEQARLRHALEALPDRTGDLTGLALDLGYTSHSHFGAAFKKHFGLSPTQYAARRN